MAGLGLWVAMAMAAACGDDGASAVLPAHGRLLATPHARVTVTEIGHGPQSYWLMEPDAPRPARAPVVVLLHGWLAVNPAIYGAWIDHLARRGFTVVFPRYQSEWLSSPATYVPNAVAALRDALEVLEIGQGRVRPDRNRVALVGHSAGGNLAALLAVVAEQNGLPRPKAVVSLFPGEVRPVAGPDLSKLPPETLLVVAAAEQDLVVGDGRARAIFRAGSLAVPPHRRLYVLYRSDWSGPFPIIAEHSVPYAARTGFDSGEGPFRLVQLNRAEVGWLDVAGTWRLTDLTLDAAFTGRSLAEGTGDGAWVRDLGHWADGRPIRPPIVSAFLDDVPRVHPINGGRLIDWGDPLGLASGETVPGWSWPKRLPSDLPTSRPAVSAIAPAPAVR
jgi:dienelactone hydrolase